MLIPKLDRFGKQRRNQLNNILKTTQISILQIFRIINFEYVAQFSHLKHHEEDEKVRLGFHVDDNSSPTTILTPVIKILNLYCVFKWTVSVFYSPSNDATIVW